MNGEIQLGGVLRRTLRLVLVGVLVLAVGVVGVQLWDPVEAHSAEPVPDRGSPEEIARVAVANLDRVDHRMTYYYGVYSNESAGVGAVTTLQHRPNTTKEFVIQSDTTDRQYHVQVLIYDHPFEEYWSLDGVWTNSSGEWEYQSCDAPSVGLSCAQAPLEPIGWRPDGASARIQNETSDTLLIHIDAPILDGYSGASGETLLRVEKDTGHLLALHQRSTYGNSTRYNGLVFDQYGAVDVERLPETPYPLRAFIWDLKRGPIPFHRWL